jgi:hypothetical protein
MMDAYIIPLHRYFKYTTCEVHGGKMDNSKLGTLQINEVLLYCKNRIKSKILNLTYAAKVLCTNKNYAAR